MAGEEFTVGIVPSSIPGEDIKQKRKALYTFTVNNFMELIQKGHAFAVHSKDTKLTVLPTGYFYVHVSTSVELLRWSTASDAADSMRVMHDIEKLLQAFPEKSREYRLHRLAEVAADVHSIKTSREEVS